MVAIETQSLQVQKAAESVRIPKEARRLLHELAAAWPDVADCRALEVVPLTGAMTNQVYQVRWLTDAPGEAGQAVAREREVRKVLMWIYGDVDLFLDRDDELRTFEYMSRHGHGPRLLGRFPNGRVEEFIHGRTLSAADLRDPEISAMLATKLRVFHNLDMPGPKHVLLWDRLKNWLKAAKNMCSSEEAEEFRLENLENALDYEYACFNPVAYDIANHFFEMAADYHSEKPHILDYTRYPDFDERERFVKFYLSTSGEEPEPEEVENLLRSIEKHTLASHLGWGLWGIISDRVNNIDFDNKEYTRQRFEQYWQQKPAVLPS